MKSLLLASSLLLSAGSAAPSSAQESLAPSSETLVLLSSHRCARVGMTREDVLDQLGEPSERLSATAWVYADFRARNRPESDKANALVVVFAKDTVRLLRLTDSASIKVALAKLRADAAKAATVARK
jgi:outer membrane protein assembly factor BamE (lipoprotein component of BamABCDE complex)